MSSKCTFTAAQLRAMSDEELAEHWSGWKPNTGNWFLTEMEVRRRHQAANELRGWLSLWLAVAAVVVSLAALFK